MAQLTMYGKSIMQRLRTGRIGCVFMWIGFGFLSGCGNTTDFLHEPPASYRVPIADQIQGVWARDGDDNGERVRVTGLADGTVRLDFFSVRPTAEPMPSEPLMVHALRFDGKEWLSVDLRKLSRLQGQEYSGHAPYKLLQYALENPDRLCGIEPGARLFADAITAGDLEGTVDTSFKPWLRVTVTSAGHDWVNWWTALPASKKVFAPSVFCFQRMN